MPIRTREGVSEMGLGGGLREKHRASSMASNGSSSSSSLQEGDGESKCGELRVRMEFVSVLVKGWTCISDNLTVI